MDANPDQVLAQANQAEYIRQVAIAVKELQDRDRQATGGANASTVAERDLNQLRDIFSPKKNRKENKRQNHPAPDERGEDSGGSASGEEFIPANSPRGVGHYHATNAFFTAAPP